MSTQQQQQPNKEKCLSFERIDQGPLNAFRCTVCENIALATQGTMLLPQKGDPLGILGLQRQEVDFIYCPYCKILEDIKDKNVPLAKEASGDFTPPEDKYAAIDFQQAIVEYYRK